MATGRSLLHLDQLATVFVSPKEISPELSLPSIFNDAGRIKSERDLLISFANG